MRAGAQARKAAPPAAAPVASRLLQRKCACGGAPGAGGECSECQKKRLDLQRKESGPGGLAIAPPIVHEVLRSPGGALDGETRSFMESRFGHDFKRVHVHSDSRAAESARAVGALAYTVGQDIVFGAGRYEPASQEGRRLLAHELVHTIQNGDARPPSNIMVSGAASASEREADAAADAVIRGDLSPTVGKAETSHLQRVPELDPESRQGIGEPEDHRAPGEPLPYREAMELLRCNELMRPGNEEYCRQRVLGEPPPPAISEPSVEIVNAALGTGVGLRFAPGGTTGTLTLDLTGAGPSHRIATGSRSGGTTTESFNVPSLPTREFTGLRATWNVGGTDHVDTRAFHIRVLGIFRHSQYNVPHESSCGGAPAPAYLTNRSCHFTPITLRSRFISQANLNGSGVSMAHGNLVREDFCLTQPGAPANAANCSFRPTANFRGACGALGNNTVANCRTRPDLHCGDRVFIEGHGTKTITDSCPACCGHDQLDNFTTAPACAGIPDLGNFMTVKVF
jgi:hypothetical protein